MFSIGFSNRKVENKQCGGIVENEDFQTLNSHRHTRQYQSNNLNYLQKNISKNQY